MAPVEDDYLRVRVWANGFRNNLCVVSINDVPNAVFAHYVHEVTIGFQHALDLPRLC